MEHQLTTKSTQKERSEKPASSSTLQPKPAERDATHPVLRLQRAVGNQAVQRMVRTRRIDRQARPYIGMHEAGSSILVPSANLPVLQRKCACGGTYGSDGECDKCKEQRLAMQRRSSSNADSASTIPPIVHNVLRSAGQPLSPATRNFMEPRFGQDFSRVKVHIDAQASESARQVNALAYTVGSDVVFGAGQYAPETSEGKRLLAHELTHVVQQAAGLPSTTRGLDGGLADVHEQEAHLYAKQIVSEVDPLSSSLKILSQTGYPIIQRYKVPGSLDCGDLVDWLNNNSPYAPEWAQTSCTYSFNGQLRISRPQPSGAGGVQLTVKGHDGLTVSVDCPIDRPEWTPSARPNRSAEVTAWKDMRATLDAHEQQHKKIGQQWRATLQSRFRSTNFTIEGTDQADAMDKVRQKIADDQQQSQADAQQAQDAIDPFRGAQLNCP